MGLKSEGMLCGVKSVVSDIMLIRRRLLNPYRSFRIQKCKGFIEQLTACQRRVNELGKCLLQKTKFRSKLYTCNWKIMNIRKITFRNMLFPYDEVYYP